MYMFPLNHPVCFKINVNAIAVFVMRLLFFSRTVDIMFVKIVGMSAVTDTRYV